MANGVGDINTITLIDEEGNEVEFDIITKLDIKDKEYIIVIPSNEEQDTAIALRIDKDIDGKDILLTIDDDDEFKIVSEAYETLFLGSDNNFN